MTIPQQNIARFVLSFFVGAAILLNQFGKFINKQVDISILNSVWEINKISELLGIATVLLISLILLTFHYLAFRNTPVLNTSFFHGLLSGFFAFPLIGIAFGVIAGVLWLLAWVFKLLQIVLSFIAIPFVWLIETVFLPIIFFIGIPFVWLWDNILWPFIAFIGVPFIWLFDNVLKPVLLFLFSYVLKPLLLVLVVVFLGLFVLLPFVLVGSVM